VQREIVVPSGLGSEVERANSPARRVGLSDGRVPDPLICKGPGLELTSSTNATYEFFPAAPRRSLHRITARPKFALFESRVLSRDSRYHSLLLIAVRPRNSAIR
jgi:hypothetical protein